ncbi:MAG: VCBS repeat-containing protein [Thioclava marina]|uniref:FG-GAP repeat domain-containing protein n=1 Tax=Thioclava marina TaxID=1915077 RepID=UPI0019BE57A4|nr:VCBS repeat-containing protein [Thioclava marina]MBC7145155.1 VCBS repeat-containing protein [Thioclava marina]
MLRAAITALLLIAAAPPVWAEVSVMARYADPTDRYGHDALGPGQEFATLFIEIARKAGSEGGLFRGQSTLTYRLPADADMVFEDTAPRIADLDGDGLPDVVVVQSNLKRGSRVLVLSAKDGAPAYLASTPFVGEPNHWVAPIGIADFNGDGHQEIALIDAPHRLGILRLYQFENGALREVFSGGKLTNHRFGADRIMGGVRDCGEGPEMIVASFDWSQLRAIHLDAEANVKWKSLGSDTSPAAFDKAMACAL